SDLVARYRSQIPTNVDLKCGSWAGQSADGFNEKELAANLNTHYVARIVQAIAAVKITGGTWAALVIGVLIGIAVTTTGGSAIAVGLLIAIGAAAYFYFQYKTLENIRQQTKTTLEKERDDALRLLRASLAEITDIRRETAREDAKADDVLDLLG